MTTTRRQFIELTAALGASVALGPGRALAATAAPKVSKSRLLMGTMVRATVIGESKAAEAAADAALDAVARVEEELSLYLPGSALSRLNRDGSLSGAPASLRTCLSHAMDIAHASKGAFDPTVQPVLEVISRSFKETKAPPSEAELKVALASVGIEKVTVRGDRIELAPGTALTFNGIAKGYGMDQARAALNAHGAEKVLITASGDMAVGPSSWNIALQDPLHPDRAIDGVRFHPPVGGVGASGGYMNYFTQDKRWHHIVDPRTGRSPTHFAGTVISAASAIEADALSTASLVLPEAEALALADSRGAALLAFRADGTMVRSRRAASVGL